MRLGPRRTSIRPPRTLMRHGCDGCHRDHRGQIGGAELRQEKRVARGLAGDEIGHDQTQDCHWHAGRRAAEAWVRRRSWHRLAFRLRPMQRPPAVRVGLRPLRHVRARFEHGPQLRRGLRPVRWGSWRGTPSRRAPGTPESEAPTGSTAVRAARYTCAIAIAIALDLSKTTAPVSRKYATQPNP